MMVPPDCPGSWLRLTDADQAPAIGPAFSQEQRLFSTDLSGCPHPSGSRTPCGVPITGRALAAARMAVDVVSETVIARPPAVVADYAANPGHAPGTSIHVKPAQP